MIELIANAVDARLLNIDRETALEIHDLLSYFVDGFEQSTAYRQHRWDGKASFFSLKTQSFPAGFVPLVSKRLNELGKQHTVRRKSAPPPLGPDLDACQQRTGFSYDPRYDYQHETVRRLLSYQQMIACLATGCHAKGTMLLKHDGSEVAVEDVVVGDQLMGPDSTPRHVLRTIRGSGRMYRIVPTKGEPFVVNEDHILSLVITNMSNGDNVKTLKIRDKNGGELSRCKGGDIVNISVRDYLMQSSSFKHVAKLWRTGVDFPSQDIHPLVHPYLLGVWLGDGDSRRTKITTTDFNVAEAWLAIGESIGLHGRIDYPELRGNQKQQIIRATLRGKKSGEGLAQKRQPNVLFEAFRELDLIQNKHIPDVYKYNDRDIRREVLAGIIDTDGYMHHGHIDLVLKQECFAKDVTFVARSLGFNVSLSKVKKGIKKTGFVGDYWRMSISGDFSEIPLRVLRRRHDERKQIKNVNRTGFKIEPIGEGDYYGFTLDKDHLYLMSDFTVTHNSGKSICAALTFLRVQRPTLFLTTRQALAYQMKATLENLGETVGMIGDATWEPNLSGFTVAMAQSLAPKLKSFDEKSELDKLQKVPVLDKNGDVLKDARGNDRYAYSEAYKRAQKRGGQAWKRYHEGIQHELSNRRHKHEKAREAVKTLLEQFEFVILEEAHESSADGYYTVMRHCKNAHYRLALTATPFVRDSDEANLRLMACSGPIGIRVDEKTLIDRGILAKPYFKYVESQIVPGISRAHWQKAYVDGIVKNEGRNTQVIQEALNGVSHGLPVLILITRTEHGRDLNRRLEAHGVRSQFLFGGTDNKSRQTALNALKDGVIQVLVASSILDIGVDVPSLGMIILAGGGKAEVAHRQRIGRGLRAKKTGANIAFIVDFMDRSNRHLHLHSEQRKGIVQGIDGFKQNILPTGQDFDWSLLSASPTVSL